MKQKKEITQEELKELLKNNLKELNQKAEAGEFWQQVPEPITVKGKKYFLAASNLGNIANLKTKKKLKLEKQLNGYLSALTTTAHRLTAEAFHLIERGEKKDIDHINGNRTDNRLTNLQAITHQENIKKRDAVKCPRDRKVQATKKGKYIGTYKNIKTAAEQLGTYSSNILRVIDKPNYTAAGYCFNYADKRGTDYYKGAK